MSNENTSWIESDAPGSSYSPSSSVYSSSEKNLPLVQHEVLDDNATTSADTLKSESGSQRSNGSFTSATSFSYHYHGNNNEDDGFSTSSGQHQSLYHQQQNHQSDSERWSQHSSTSTTSTSSRKKVKERNPFKWIYGHSDSNSCSTTRNPIPKHRQQVEADEESPPNSVISLAERMDMIKEKVNALSSSPYFTTPGVTSCPKPLVTEENKGQGIKIDMDIQTDLEILDRQHRELHREYQPQRQASTTKITHLTNTNTNLSTLNALILSDFRRSQRTVHELQAEVSSLRRQNTELEKRQSAYEEQMAQIELYVDVIQRLGELLGKREEQLRLEERRAEIYREKVIAVEDNIDMLKMEWESILPAISRGRHD